MQVTLESDPTLVKPVLQVQMTSNVTASWEQTALVSHPPLLTKQLSATERRRGMNRLEIDAIEVQLVYLCK